MVVAEAIVSTGQTASATPVHDSSGSEAEIAAFRAGHLYETNDHLDANLRLLDARQNVLEKNDVAAAKAENHLQELQAQLDTEGASAVPSAPGRPDPFLTRLADLQAELEALQSRYQDNHPSVRAKQRELDELLATGADEDGEDEDAASGVLTPLEAEIQGAERDVRRLQREREQILADIALYQNRIENTPHVQQQLAERSKGLAVMEKQYDDYRTKADQAHAAQRVEEDQQGQQFEQMEAAVPPRQPVSPRPPLFYGAGLIAGLVLFVIPAVLPRVLHPVIRSETGLRALTEVPVLVTIPRFDTPGPVSRHFDELGYHVTTGIGPDLMAGAKSAVSGMIDLLGATHGLSAPDAYMLCSVCADLRISEAVDQPNWVVSLYFPRVVFE